MKLEIKNLHKSFGDNEILHGISFSAKTGSALGLLGRNGAGKTTTIRILMKVFEANSGEVLLDGVPFSPQKGTIGYLPEERGLYPKKKVGEQMVYLAELRGMNARDAREAVKKWLKRLGVEEYENRRLETLSKGNQQKVQLAQTLVNDPSFIILDEPFSGLDPVNSQILKDVINEEIARGKLVIFSSHQMSYVEEFCQDIVILNHGNIVLSGDLRDIKREFGKNRLVLTAVNLSGEALSEKIREEYHDLVTVCGRWKDGVIMELNGSHRKTELLGMLADSDIDVENFGNYEPSLNDIFVESAGDEA
ncbi:MAG: ATP-binding cassette domain-containing protein [Lachnospiraceae bacterium]|nr:ATP-binding cassette domain-containing protein [Lachnospiraceae bacterium]